MGQIAVIERSRLKALDIETVIALSTATEPSAKHNWLGPWATRQSQKTNRTYIMSHSTEIKVEIGLDSYHLHCGSRHPAEYCGVAANQSKTLVDDAALAVLWNMPHNGAGRMALFRSRGKQVAVCRRHWLAQSGDNPLRIIARERSRLKALDIETNK